MLRCLLVRRQHRMCLYTTDYHRVVARGITMESHLRGQERQRLLIESMLISGVTLAIF
jgi:hypothetical protein